jgi:PAS domain S-box-containing protein
MKDIVEAIFASTPDAIVTADSGGRIISWNPAAERIFGHGIAAPSGEKCIYSMSTSAPSRLADSHTKDLHRC